MIQVPARSMRRGGLRPVKPGDRRARSTRLRPLQAPTVSLAGGTCFETPVMSASFGFPQRLVQSRQRHVHPPLPSGTHVLLGMTVSLLPRAGEERPWNTTLWPFRLCGEASTIRP